MNISHLSITELNELKKRIDAEIAGRKTAERDALIHEFRRRAAELGLSVEDLVGSKSTGKRGKVAVKYRHPHDASLTWTGRGKRPRWVDAWTTDGGSLDQLAV